MHPRIAITARSFMNGSNRAYFSNESYLKAIIEAQGNPCVVTPNTRENIAILIDQCDGLLVTGGSDLNPTLYDQKKHPATEGIDDEIDHLDLFLIQEFYRKGKPILGICRGLQAINVAFGGTLMQDIPTQHSKMREGGHVQKKPGSDVEHMVYFNEGTYAHQLFGNVHAVNSFHHQAISQIGRNLTSGGTSEDGLIEAIEGDHLFAVQWHPERLLDDEKQRQIFIDFIQLCKNNSSLKV